MSRREERACGAWGGESGGTAPALALLSCRLPPSHPLVILAGSMVTKTSGPWMPEKATRKRESWLLDRRYPCPAVLQTGQTSSDHRAFAHATPSPPTTFPRCQHGFLPSLCSGGGQRFSLTLPLSPPPYFLPLPSDNPHHHRRPHFAVCSGLCLRMHAVYCPTCQTQSPGTTACLSSRLILFKLQGALPPPPHHHCP